MKKIDLFIKKYLAERPAFMSFIRPQEAYLFTRFKKYIKAPILDFGCGDGFFAKTTFGKGKIDVGLDLFDNPRIKEAIKEDVYKKITLYDGKKIPYQTNFFQTIISNCVLEHVKDLDYSLKEIRRVLNRGGFFLTTVMTDKWNQYLFGKKIFGQFYIDFMNKKQKHYNLLNLDSWQRLFKKKGFEIIKKLGYLSEKNSQLLDIFHYLSIPSLISYKLFNRWVIYPRWYRFLKIENFIKNNLTYPPLSQSAAVFFLLKKTNSSFYISTPLGDHKQ